MALLWSFVKHISLEVTLVPGTLITSLDRKHITRTQNFGLGACFVEEPRRQISGLGRRRPRGNFIQGPGFRARGGAKPPDLVAQKQYL